ncbi:MAG: hypothetical protein NZ869_06070 [Thermoanaerobaculum sp.]|nr:hypothetical protein [Thermoanaerobaculum sp.]MDW7968261.1 hypothetical protein [Thermoanaerobaculum sp.]
MSTLWPFPDEALRVQRFPALASTLARILAAVRDHRLASTLLIVGPPFAGREALAAELAAMLICGKGELCCSCSHCRRVRDGVHPDLHLVRQASGHREIRVEDVNEALASPTQVPFEGASRVFVVCNAHTPPLNVFAASALLKALEEPASHAHWLLLATNPQRVLPTLVSRAVLLRVPTPAPGGLPAGFGPRMSQLVETVPGSLGSLAEEGEEGEEFLALAEELSRHMLAGDLLALLRLAAQVRERPWRAPVLASLFLKLARHQGGEAAERCLDAAEGWLLASRIHEQLHLGFEPTALAVLGPLVTRP